MTHVPLHAMSQLNTPVEASSAHYLPPGVDTTPTPNSTDQFACFCTSCTWNPPGTCLVSHVPKAQYSSVTGVCNAMFVTFIMSCVVMGHPFSLLNTVSVGEYAAFID